MFDSFFARDLNLPKPEFPTLQWLVGTLLGTKQKTGTVSCFKKCMIFFSFYLFQVVIIFTCVGMDLNSRSGLNR